MKLRYILLLLASLSTCVVTRAQAPVKDLYLVQSGGLSEDALREAYVKPFAAKTGVIVKYESPNVLGKLQAMVRSKNATADLMELAAGNTAIARSQGLIEPLDWALIDPAPMLPEAKLPDAFGYQLYSVIIGWKKGTKPMNSWADFWNTKDYPGRRALIDDPTWVIPIALLADGVKPEELYPPDIDRAFRKIRQLKDSLIWWSAGSQAPQYLQDGEAAYVSIFSSRIVRVPELDYTFNQGLAGMAFWVIPKGADPAKKATAMKLLHEMSLPENQVISSRIVNIPGASPNLDRLLGPEELARFPTSPKNRGSQIALDWNWPAQNAQLIERRWAEFKLSR